MALTMEQLYTQMASTARKDRKIFTASFELTARCNLQCKMCYVCQPANDSSAIAKELSTDQWIRLGREARDAGLLFVTLTGGEILLRKDFKELYKSFSDMGLLIQLYTNSTLMTEEFIDWLAKIPPYKVSITFYGASRETYKKITGSAEAYDRTIRSIDSLIAHDIRTEIRTTVVKGNKHEYDQLLDFTMERKKILGIVNYVSPRREGDNSDPLGNRLSPQELFEYEMHMNQRDKEIAAGIEVQKSIVNDSVKEDFPVKIPKEQFDPNDAFQCWGGRSSAWFTWDGRLLPCGLLDEPITYPLEKGFISAWEELKSACDDVPVCIECRECQYEKFCEHCPARLKRESGSYNKPAPYLCELAQKRAMNSGWTRR